MCSCMCCLSILPFPLPVLTSRERPVAVLCLAPVLSSCCSAVLHAASIIGLSAKSLFGVAKLLIKFPGATAAHVPLGRSPHHPSALQEPIAGYLHHSCLLSFPYPRPSRPPPCRCTRPLLFLPSYSCYCFLPVSTSPQLYPKYLSFLPLSHAATVLVSSSLQSRLTPSGCPGILSRSSGAVMMPATTATTI